MLRSSRRLCICVDPKRRQSYADVTFEINDYCLPCEPDSIPASKTVYLPYNHSVDFSVTSKLKVDFSTCFFLVQTRCALKKTTSIASGRELVSTTKSSG
eukprot:6213938-Pleurochrysis_carterae.AAC.3